DCRTMALADRRSPAVNADLGRRRRWLPPFEHRDETAGLGAGMMPRSRFVADEVAGLEHGAVGVDELAFEDDGLLESGMVVVDGGGGRLHAHEIAALPGGAVETDRQPAHLRLHGALEIIGEKGRLADAEHATANN